MKDLHLFAKIDTVQDHIFNPPSVAKHTDSENDLRYISINIVIIPAVVRPLLKSQIKCFVEEKERKKTFKKVRSKKLCTLKSRMKVEREKKRENLLRA